MEMLEDLIERLAIERLENFRNTHCGFELDFTEAYQLSLDLCGRME